MATLDDLEVRVSSLESNRVELAARIRRAEKWIDAVESSLWKRVWFVLQGYRFRRLGVWYRARWNKDGWEY